MRIVTIILVFLLLFLPVTAVLADTLSIDAPVYGISGETLTVTVRSDGVPLEGADVYFILNDGTPVHTRTDGSGEAVYKPLLPGMLRITTIYGGEDTGIEIPIYEPAYGVNLTVVGDSTKTVAPGEDATYLLRVTNTGNVTDTIKLTIDGPGSLNTTSLQLEPGASGYVLLTVSGPSGTYTTAITATSTSSISESVRITTVVSSGGGGYHGGGGPPRDSDGDGYNDIQEMVAGTDPYDPSSYPGALTEAPTPTMTATQAPSPATTTTATPTPTRTPAPTESKADNLRPIRWVVIGIILAVLLGIIVAYIYIQRR